MSTSILFTLSTMARTFALSIPSGISKFSQCFMILLIKLPKIDLSLISGNCFANCSSKGFDMFTRRLFPFTVILIEDKSTSGPNNIFVYNTILTNTSLI